MNIDSNLCGTCEYLIQTRNKLWEKTQYVIDENL